MFIVCALILTLAAGFSGAAFEEARRKKRTYRSTVVGLATVIVATVLAVTLYWLIVGADDGIFLLVPVVIVSGLCIGSITELIHLSEFPVNKRVGYAIALALTAKVVTIIVVTITVFTN